MGGHLVSGPLRNYVTPTLSVTLDHVSLDPPTPA